jgi:predicted nucleic acid-binding protein
VIFIDTSFWIGLTAPRDGHHDEARALLNTFEDDPWVTSNLIRGETWTYLRRRMGHDVAVEFLDRIVGSRRLAVLCITPDLEERALGWLRKHDERAYSFVDATSFALMRSLKIRRALAFDGDFTAAGFTELRPHRCERRHPATTWVHPPVD